MVVPFVEFTTKKWVVLANKIDQLFIGVGIITKAIKTGRLGSVALCGLKFVQTRGYKSKGKPSVKNLLFFLTL